MCEYGGLTTLPVSAMLRNTALNLLGGTYLSTQSAFNTNWYLKMQQIIASWRNVDLFMVVRVLEYVM